MIDTKLNVQDYNSAFTTKTKTEYINFYGLSMKPLLVLTVGRRVMTPNYPYSIRLNTENTIHLKSEQLKSLNQKN